MILFEFVYFVCLFVSPSRTSLFLSHLEFLMRVPFSLLQHPVLHRQIHAACVGGMRPFKKLFSIFAVTVGKTGNIHVSHVCVCLCA